jgi:hypothetical protein
MQVDPFFKVGKETFDIQRYCSCDEGTKGMFIGRYKRE